jgi:hypothetical protein
MHLPQRQLHEGFFIERIKEGAIHLNRESRRLLPGKPKLQKSAKQVPASADAGIAKPTVCTKLKLSRWVSRRPRA